MHENSGSLRQAPRNAACVIQQKRIEWPWSGKRSSHQACESLSVRADTGQSLVSIDVLW